jgi:hypothetical protein
MNIDMQQVTNQMRFYISEIKTLQTDKDNLTSEVKKLKDTLALEQERYRGIITELEVELDKFKENE